MPFSLRYNNNRNDVIIIKPYKLWMNVIKLYEVTYHSIEKNMGWSETS